jgi:hypothetical protein
MTELSRGYIDQRARAELLSSVGACALGAGLGLVFRDALTVIMVPLLLLGAAMHVLGMSQKHRLDALQTAAQPGWTLWAYWTCWLLLFGLAVYVVVTSRTIV